jgi:hypothetical protein
MLAALGDVLDRDWDLPGRRRLFVYFTIAHVDVRS